MTSKVGSAATTITCSNGYAMTGSASAVCTAGTGATASWIQPTCTAVSCGALTVLNSNQAGGTVTSKVGDAATTVTCSNGYAMTGSASAVCTAGTGAAASWIKPLCDGVSCGALTVLNSNQAGILTIFLLHKTTACDCMHGLLYVRNHS